MENLKLGFKIYENNEDMFLIGHYKDNDANKNFYGEFFISVLYSRMFKYYITEVQILCRGFCYEGKNIGILKNFSDKPEYFSIITPGKKLDNKFEYNKELYLIRAGLIEKPIAYDCLDVKIPDNWGEIFKEELNK
jgi:hypothetical protein